MKPEVSLNHLDLRIDKIPGSSPGMTCVIVRLDSGMTCVIVGLDSGMTCVIVGLDPKIFDYRRR